jgi:thioester reductase-like protein
LKSIVECIEHWAAEKPDQTAFAFVGSDGRVLQRFTYRGLNERTRTVALHLVRHCGLRHGERAILLYPPGLDFTVAFLSCVRVGIIPVPVPMLARVESVAADCGAEAVIAPRAAESPGVGPSLRWISTEDMPDDAGPLQDDPGDVLFLQYTSGSTSDPRGVVVSHANVLCNAAGAVSGPPIGVSWLPHFHDMGLIGYQLFPLVAGGMAYGLSPLAFLKRPVLWFETVSRVRATRTSAPNFAFEYCLRPGKITPEQLQELDLSSLTVLMNAAEPVCSETYERFIERFARCGLDPCAATAAYGLAENTLAVTHSGRRSLEVDAQLLGKSIVRPALRGSKRVRVHSCGMPIDGVSVRVVDPDTRRGLPEGVVGEIWVSGTSVTRGYWNRPEETAEVFENTLVGEPGCFLKTGDLGFLDSGELFVCGRTKDVIIVRGANHYPHDIEAAAIAASSRLRHGGVAAFAGDRGEPLVIVAEALDPAAPPDPAAICRAVRARCSVAPDVVALVPPRTIARTTSGKKARHSTRERYLDGTLPVLSVYRADSQLDLRERFGYVRRLLDPELAQDATFADLGLDSLLLTEFAVELEELLEELGAGDSIEELDLTLLQELQCSEFFARIDALVDPSAQEVAEFGEYLRSVRRRLEVETEARMRTDAALELCDLGTIYLDDEPLRTVLLTGPTGFFGPFLLDRLLRDTPYDYCALVRAENAWAGLNRIRESLRGADLLTPSVADALASRVRVVCGDLAKPNLGLASDQWDSLVRETQALIHNAAAVNYVQNYEALRGANVVGTRTLLRFAHSARRKEFHLISTTFVFGWTVESLLTERDTNAEMKNLDFGYSQTKWVAEKLVRKAGELGLPVQIYRPALLSTSMGGAGDESDVLIRLLAFMINHGIAVDSKNQLSIVPADIAAANIAAIFGDRSRLGRTFNVTVDDYYNITDLTQLISRRYGYPMMHQPIPEFIVTMNRLCKPHEPLYPLLDFFNRSASKIAAMQLKRYRNDAYRKARTTLPSALPDPTLEETISCLVTFMQRKGLISRSPSEPSGRLAWAHSGPRATSRSDAPPAAQQPGPSRRQSMG